MKTSSILIRVSEEEKDLFQSQADKENLSLSMWIRCNLMDACDSKLDPIKSKEAVENGEVYKCCACPSVDVQYYPERNRYFCMAHRP